MKISVVVPVYNVQNYLDKCMDSLVNQTFEDYEVILVDDGSSDNSGAKCDYYDGRYEFVHTYHKPNGGLSDARNYGIEHSSGEYISFVDSDDYVSHDYLELLYGMVNTTGTEIAVVGHINEYENEDVKKDENNVGYDIIVLTPKEAIRELCYEKGFSTSACGKLFKKEIVLKTRFPVGKLYEDLFTIYKLLDSGNLISFSDTKKYHYIQRYGSIRKREWSSKHCDLWQASLELKEYVETTYAELSDDVNYRLFFSAHELFILSMNYDDFYEVMNPIIEYLKPFWKSVRRNNRISFKQRIKYYMMIQYPLVYKTIRRCL